MEQRGKQGTTDGLARFSVGLEDPADLQEVLQRALGSELPPHAPGGPRGDSRKYFACASRDAEGDQYIAAEGGGGEQALTDAPRADECRCPRVLKDHGRRGGGDREQDHGTRIGQAS